MTDPIVLQSTGDVKGPVSSTDNSMVLFSGTSGKVIKGNNAVVTAAGLALLDDNNNTEQRNTLGLGSISTQNSNAVTISGGQITGISRLYLASDDNSVPTAAPNTNTAQIASTAHVFAGLATKANLSHLHDTSHITSGILSTNRGGTGVNTSTGSGSNVLSVSPALTGVPTAPTAASDTNTTQIATTAFVQSKLGVGYDQTWQNLVGSRVKNTDYTNTTGRPIAVCVSCATGNYDAYFTIQGVRVGKFVAIQGAGSITSCVTVIVPPNAVYRVTTPGNIITWEELR